MSVWLLAVGIVLVPAVIVGVVLTSAMLAVYLMGRIDRRQSSSAGCARCREISATAARDLIYIWNPTRPPFDEEAEGERIRTLALALHAAAGHPA